MTAPNFITFSFFMDTPSFFMDTRSYAFLSSGSSVKAAAHRPGIFGIMGSLTPPFLSFALDNSGAEFRASSDWTGGRVG